MPQPDETWTAVVLAGQRPSGDPLVEHFGIACKAHLPVAGLPMLSRVVATLRASPRIGRIVVMSQDAKVMDVLEPGQAEHVASTGGISASLAGLAGSEAVPWPILVTTADHPLLTPECVSFMLEQGKGCDLAVGMVNSATLLARYPENRRTWFKLRDGWWTGANLFALGGEKVLPALRLWSQVEQDRKSVVKLFARFGLSLFLRAVTRTVGMRDGLAIAGKRLGLDARLVDLPFAEAAIDVDKPSDHALAESILSGR